ncbi:unnamed protein product [Sympodiomycopsis kandeliae]
MNQQPRPGQPQHGQQQHMGQQHFQRPPPPPGMHAQQQQHPQQHPQQFSQPPGARPRPGQPQPMAQQQQQQFVGPPRGLQPSPAATNSNSVLQPPNRNGLSPQPHPGQMRPPSAGPGPRPPQPQPNHLAAQMANLNVGGPASPGPVSPTSPGPGPVAGPAKTKRSARAYHQQQDHTAGTDAGWNDAPPNPVQQQAWQQAANDRLAQYGDQPHAFESSDADDALDQIPGQRNTIHPLHAAANQQRLAAHQQQQQQHQQQVPLTPGAPGPHTPASQHPPSIQQPPHQAGQRLRGPKANIDPDQIPAPVEPQEADQAAFDREWFQTCGRGPLPLSTTDFAAVDQGNCNPKHMRLSTYSIPFTEELANTAQLPLAVNVQPFAQLRADEAPVPVVDCGPAGPPRCKKCRAYINPWAVFVEGGQKWVCNLCGTSTPVAPEYFCNLDMSGRRADFDQRLELQRGSVDFLVPREYWAIQSKPPSSVLLPVAPEIAQTETAVLTDTPDANGSASAAASNPASANDPNAEFTGSTMGLSGQSGAAAKAATKAASEALNNFSAGPGRTSIRAPRPLTYFFAIDVSYSAVRCGSLKATTESIREALYGPRSSSSEGQEQESNGQESSSSAGPGFGLPHGSRIAILTFDRALHFYNLSAELDSAQMLVVADIDEPFVPISSGLLADPWESRHVVEGLLDNLPTIFADNMSSEAALGPVIRGAQACLSTIGGQVNIFLSTIPTVGPGALKHREDTKLYGTDKEKQLFVPADGFYRGVAEECVEAGIGLNVFFFPSQYIDVASIGTMACTTGGDIYFHPRFDLVRDTLKLQAQVQRAVLREVGYNATLRLRCSNGLHTTQHYGNFFQRNLTDLEIANLHADQCVSVQVKHDGRLDEKSEAHFQAATLYTTADGQRRVRVHNIAVPVTSLLGNVFRYADVDSTITFYSKEASTLATSKSLQEVRHYLTDRCVKILLAYRKNCASSSVAGQLILPESSKLLPLYTLAINKTKAIKGGNVTSDVRAYYMRLFRSIGVGATMGMLYPRMVALHNMSPQDGSPIKIAQGDGTEIEGMRIQCPRLMRPSFQRMEGHGAYLIENGDNVLLWIGANVNPRLLDDLYGVNSLEELDPRMTKLPSLPTKLSKQARALVTSFATQHQKPSLPVLIARQNRDASEVEAANMLVEDENNGAMSFVDYLCHVHRIISTNIAQGAQGNNSSNSGEVSQSEAHSLWRGW